MIIQYIYCYDINLKIIIYYDAFLVCIVFILFTVRDGNVLVNIVKVG